MKNAPAIHLAIIQPAGYVHSLGFLDQARYFRHMFRRQGRESDHGQEPVARGCGELRVRRAPRVSGRLARAPCLHLREPGATRPGRCGRQPGLPRAAAPLGRGRLRRRQRAGLRAGSERRAHRVVRLRRLPGQARAAPGRTPDRPAVLRQRESAPPAVHRPRGSRGLQRGHVRRAGLRPGARRLHPPLQGGAELPLLREQPLRAGARVPLPVARHAGDLRIHAHHRPGARFSRFGAVATHAGGRLVRPALRHARVLRGSAQAPGRVPHARRRARPGRAIRRPAGVRQRFPARLRTHPRARPVAPARDQPGFGQGLQAHLAEHRHPGSRRARPRAGPGPAGDAALRSADADGRHGAPGSRLARADLRQQRAGARARPADADGQRASSC